MSEAITELLLAVGRGDAGAQDRLFPLLYDELHRCAHRQLRGSGGETLSTTALVNETYLKLLAGETLDVGSRAHFMALAARAMRQVLIDSARRSGADKRGGFALKVTLDADSAIAPDAAADVLALDQALTTLEQVDERASRVVQLHFFAGLSFAEIAEIEGITLRTVMRDWQAARALLAGQLKQDALDGSRT
ncbi:MAG: sigma-70 family RNA polymerase sigma factor [Xanthomonadales bacterium]|nr:sigma-70 family RNA polymerase sigma factor [Xanthomonadales bacterium]